MSCKLKHLFCLFLAFFLPLFLNSQSIPNTFIDDNSLSNFSELFTLNVSVMRFRNRGNINDINPVDSDNLVKIIKSTINNISSASLQPKDVLIKTVNYLSKKDTTKKFIYENLRERIQYSPQSNIDKFTKDIMIYMGNNKELSVIKDKWFENHNKSIYSVKTGETLEYNISHYKTICEKQSPQSDLLITGDIEKVDNNYLITILFYSPHSDTIINKTAFLTSIDKISENIEIRFKEITKLVFNIKFANLTINTNENTEIFINSKYMAKENIHIPFVKPDSYLVTLREPNAKPFNEVIYIKDNENRMIDLTPDFYKHKQAYLFNIEPSGTKIFINSQFAGQTPFRKELPQGEFVISAKASDLYQDYRYTLTVNDITSDELAIQYHLMTKDMTKLLKTKQNLYYSAFWTFTFSLALTIPTTIMAVQFFSAPNIFSANSTEYIELLKSKENDDPTRFDSTDINLHYDEIALISEILRYSSIGLALNTVVSLTWLFYSLFDYLNAIEKKDFIPILNFYSSPKESGIIIGGVIQIPDINTSKDNTNSSSN